MATWLIAKGFDQSAIAAGSVGGAPRWQPPASGSSSLEAAPQW